MISWHKTLFTLLLENRHNYYFFKRNVHPNSNKPQYMPVFKLNIYDLILTLTLFYLIQEST